MQLFSKDDGTWQIEHIRDLELLMLNRLEEATDRGESESVKKRFFPSPLGRPAIDDEEDEIIDDWESLVHPDLDSQFKKSVKVVLDDLKSIKEERDQEYSLVVSKKHADDWVSALNQARLILHERFKLPDEEETLAAIEETDDDVEEEEEEDDDDGISPDQWLAMVQSDVYGGIMEFLIRDVLWLK